VVVVIVAAVGARCSLLVVVVPATRASLFLSTLIVSLPIPSTIRSSFWSCSRHEAFECLLVLVGDISRRTNLDVLLLLLLLLSLSSLKPRSPICTRFVPVAIVEEEEA